MTSASDTTVSGQMQGRKCTRWAARLRRGDGIRRVNKTKESECAISCAEIFRLLQVSSGAEHSGRSTQDTSLAKIASRGDAILDTHKKFIHQPFISRQSIQQDRFKGFAFDRGIHIDLIKIEF